MSDTSPIPDDSERAWVSRISPADGETSRGSVQVSSYNILSQYYAATTRHLYQHLEGERESLLEWENRWPKIKDELENLGRGYSLDDESF